MKQSVLLFLFVLIIVMLVKSFHSFSQDFLEIKLEDSRMNVLTMPYFLYEGKFVHCNFVAIDRVLGIKKNGNGKKVQRLVISDVVEGLMSPEYVYILKTRRGKTAGKNCVFRVRSLGGLPFPGGKSMETICSFHFRAGANFFTPPAFPIKVSDLEKSECSGKLFKVKEFVVGEGWKTIKDENYELKPFKVYKVYMNEECRVSFEGLDGLCSF